MKRDEAVLNAVVVEVEPTLFLPFASRDDASEAVVLLVLGYGVERLRGRELDRAGKVVWEVVLEPLVIPDMSTLIVAPKYRTSALASRKVPNTSSRSSAASSSSRSPRSQSSGSSSRIRSASRSSREDCLPASFSRSARRRRGRRRLAGRGGSASAGRPSRSPAGSRDRSAVDLPRSGDSRSGWRRRRRSKKTISERFVTGS